MVILPKKQINMILCGNCIIVILLGVLSIYIAHKIIDYLQNNFKN